LAEIYPYITCVPVKAAAAPAGSVTGGVAGTTAAPPPTFVGKVNINTASKTVLMCLPQFTEQDADQIIQYRESSTADPSQVTNIAWLLDVVPAATLTAAGTMITGQSTVYSADIVTVTVDGRAFKRVKVVVDASSGTPQIVYRRDITNQGWPLDPELRNMLRRGEDISEIQDDPSNSGSRVPMGVR